MAPFARLARAAGATVDRVMADEFRWEPHVAPVVNGRPDVNAPFVPDPKRDPTGRGVLFKGVFCSPGERMHAEGRSMSNSTTKTIAGEKPHIDVAVENVPPGLMHGDRIVSIASTGGDGSAFVVTRVLPVEVGRLAIHLAESR